MQDFTRFHYKTLADVLDELDRLGLALPVSESVDILARPIRLDTCTVPNRLAVHPMEGCDSAPDGSPTDLVRRRYRRFAAGGSGLIWFEACAVVPEGRANPRQMMLTEQNVDSFARLLDELHEAAREGIGPDHRPVTILQLNHAGRYSKPEGRPAPIIAHHSQPLDPSVNLPPDYPLISDDELDRLQDDFVRVARLARRAGFDGVDVKACHGYLLGGLLAARTREGSRYGGPEYENRTRMTREIHARIADECPGLIDAARINVYDGLPRPWGWGVAEDDPTQADLEEPVRLVRDLHAQGAPCVNVTICNPYFHPHLNRPHDNTEAGRPRPPEHPLVGVHRLVDLAGRVQRSCPGVAIVGTGYSYLRQFIPQFGAGVLHAGMGEMIGLGREAFAYPDFARDIVEKGEMDPRKVCITCSLCTQIMRDGGRAGCPVRDREVYGPILRRGRAEAAE
jgi:2,4-dienoyl-CoA reductase-like NADH-dependent reductase (Old Yellow Enzyme family)